METRRKTLGRRIKAARRAAGYKSARAFAQAIGVSESSVANAEIGSERVGAGVYLDIETGLGWPHGCVERYLESGDLGELPAELGSRPRPAFEALDEFEREVLSSPLSDSEKEHWIQRHRAAIAEERDLLQRLAGIRPSGGTAGQSANLAGHDRDTDR